MKHNPINTFAAILIAFSLTTEVFAKNPIKVATLQVEGMTSAACPVLLTSAVDDIEGVTNVHASLESHSATIEFDEDLASLEEIQEIIEDRVGFTIHVK